MKKQCGLVLAASAALASLSISSGTAYAEGRKTGKQTVQPTPISSPAQSTTQPTMPAQGKYVLIMTLGYLGGQPGAFLSKPGSAAVDAVMIKFNSMSQCEYVQTQMEERWRKDIFNSICIALPEGAEIIG